MSFLAGPECSTGSNPLSQFSKHVQGDRTLQRDRLLGGGRPGSLPEDMHSAGALGPSAENNETNKVRFVFSFFVCMIVSMNNADGFAAAHWEVGSLTHANHR